MGMSDDEVEQQMVDDESALMQVQELLSELVKQQPVSTVFFLELIGIAWTYLRTLHDGKDTAALVRHALINAEEYMQDEPMLVITNDTGQSVEVPMYPAEMGGLAASDEAADALFEILDLDFTA